MSFQKFLLAAICVHSLAAFQFPVVVDDGKNQVPSLSADCSAYIFQAVNDANKLIALIQRKDWENAKWEAIDLGKNLLAAYECLHRSDVGQFIQTAKNAVTGQCPYLKCVKKHLCAAHHYGVKFVKLLWWGKKDCAKKVLKKLEKELEAATECGKHK